MIDVGAESIRFSIYSYAILHASVALVADNELLLNMSCFATSFLHLLLEVFCDLQPNKTELGDCCWLLGFGQIKGRDQDTTT
jgi:hypothetical protein